MLYELDHIDREILAVLLHDGRTPAAQIADQVGLSRPSVAERMDRLTERGVIRGITAVADPRALGLTVTAFVSARHGGPHSLKLERAFRKFVESDEVLEIHSVAGDDCYLIKVRTDSIPSLNTLVTQLTNPPLSMTTRTTIVMETYCEKVSGVNLIGEDPVEA